MERLLFGAVVVTVAITGMSVQSADHSKDSLGDVKKAVADEKAVLIDVRESDEWKDGHLQGAKHLALSRSQVGCLLQKLKLLIPAGKIVYLHCAAGGRCLKAADLLKAAGYETRPLKSGYDDLVKAGFEMAK